MANIYFFDPLVALEAAKRRQSVNTNLQMGQEQICFYNGEVFADMPDNCISVPINNFYNYFFTTTHSLPQQMNFDNQSFNDTTKQEITQSIIDTLTQVKDSRVKIIVQILNAPLQESTAHAYILVLLEYLQFIDVAPDDIEKEILTKLLDLVRFSVDHQLPLSSELENTTKIIFEFVQNKYPLLLEKSIKLMHLQYALFSLLTSNQQLDTYFNNLIQLLNDLPSIINDYVLVSHVFPEKQLSDYLQRMNKALFNKDFIASDIIIQKQILYKFFFLTNLIYGRGEAYQKMYFFLYPYFLQAIDKKLDELVFYLYTPLLMSWNGTAQTQKEFKQFNHDVEKPLEDFIANALISKYKLKPTTRAINNKKPIKVAFLQERIINYSVNNVFISLIKSLMENTNNHYEFLVYDLNFIEFGGSDKKAVNSLKQLGIKYIDLHKECVGDSNVFYSIVEKSLTIRNKIIHDNIDILIGMNTRPEYNFLFSTRTAAKQIYWSHGNFEYNIKTIDAKISHSYSSRTDYTSFSLPKDKSLYNPDVPLFQIQEVRKRYPQDVVILGSLGRLSKLNSKAYIQTVAKIMNIFPNTIYLACGAGDKTEIEELCVTYGIESRFYFPGFINAHLYGHVIDLFLDSFPHRQGESLQEFFMKGKPFVSYLNEEEYALPAVLDHYSPNLEHYIALASKLIESTEFRQSFGKSLAEKAENSVNYALISDTFIKTIGE